MQTDYSLRLRTVKKSATSAKRSEIAQQSLDGGFVDYRPPVPETELETSLYGGLPGGFHYSGALPFLTPVGITDTVSVMQSSSVKVWRYYLPPDKEQQNPLIRDSWSIVFVDSLGAVSVISDHGNWSHFWSSGHSCSDFREQLLSFNSHYVADKFSYGITKVLHPELTRKATREKVCSLRRHRLLTSKQARQDWKDSDWLSNSLDFYQFLEKHAHRWKFYTASSVYLIGNWEGLKHWTEVSFPRLKRLIKAQIVLEPQLQARMLA